LFLNRGTGGEREKVPILWKSDGSLDQRNGEELPKSIMFAEGKKGKRVPEGVKDHNYPRRR